MADTHSIAEKMRLSEPTAKNGMKIDPDPYYQRQKFSSMSLVFGGVRFMWIFKKVPSNDSGVVENGNF